MQKKKIVCNQHSCFNTHGEQSSNQDYKNFLSTVDNHWSFFLCTAYTASV